MKTRRHTKSDRAPCRAGAGVPLRVRLSALALPLIGIALLGCEEPRPAPTHVVFVAIDTLRPDHLSHRGYPAPTSPRLDAFAAESIAFEDAQSPSPWTAPALLSLMTSLYPEVHGVDQFPNPGRMDDRVLTLADILSERGYRTAAFTEGGYAKGSFGLDQGFDDFPSNPGDEASHGSNLQHGSRIAGNVDRALAWLALDAATPFFLFFHTYEIHFPYRAPKDTIQRFWRGYSPQGERKALAAIGDRWSRGQPLSPAGWDRLVVHHLHCQLRELPAVSDRARLQGRVLGRIRAFEEGRLELSPLALDHVRALYDAEIHYTDQQIGRLLDGLASDTLFAQEERDRTLVVIVSDHGEGLGEHRRIQHGTHLHDELTRALLLLRIPGRKPTRISNLARTIDLVPTLLDLLHIDVPDARFQGRSLLPWLSGRPDRRHSYASALARSQQEHSEHAVRSDRWSLIEDRSSGAARLYDRRTDPGEQRDVGVDHPSTVAEMRETLRGIAATNRIWSQSYEAVKTQLPKDSEAELKALGYIE